MLAGMCIGVRSAFLQNGAKVVVVVAGVPQPEKDRDWRVNGRTGIHARRSGQGGALESLYLSLMTSAKR